MKNLQGFKKPLLPLLRSTSEPKLSLFGRVNRKKIVDEGSSEDECEVVAKLSEWEKKDSKLEVLNSIDEATLRLNKKITGQDLVEEIIVKRKHNNKLPKIKSSRIISLADTSKKRQIQKENESNFRERCRYFRNFEEDLNKTYNNYVNAYNQIKSERNNLREVCCEIKKKSTAAIEEFEKVKDDLKKFEEKRNFKSKEEMLEWNSRKEKLVELLEQRHQEKIKVTREIDEEIKAKSVQLNELDDLCKVLRKKVDIVKKAQTKHYFGLLKEGKDTKGEGLHWIVTVLWRLGETVSLDNFPSFLDEDAIHCILFIAQKSLEADEIFENIINPARKSTTLDRSAEKSIDIKERIARLTKRIKIEKPEYIYDKKTKQVTIKWIPCDTSYATDYFDDTGSEVNIYESYISKIKEMIQITKESEIQRLAVECNLHHYQERYKITLRDLINTIVGNELTEKYLAIITKQQQALTEKIESTKTFNFTSRLI